MAIPFASLEFLPENERLFCEMVEASMEATKASGRLFLFLAHMGGNSLVFAGPPRRSWEEVDEGALTDFVTYGLLHLDYGGRGTPNYRVSNDGYRYYRYLQERRGTPIVQIEETVRRFLDGEDFAQRYPKATQALGKATSLLWTGELDDQHVSELGAAMRAALQDFTVEFLAQLGVAAEASPEKPIQGLKNAVDRLSDRLGEREPAVLKALVDLAEVELREIQRIHHVRDEGKVHTWDELRRATFLLTLVMYELDHAAASR